MQREPLYVVQFELDRARIVVGPRPRSRSGRCVSPIGTGSAKGKTVKVRSLAPAVDACRDGEWINFDRPEYGVAPGQAAVAYEGSRVLGGGWIAETTAAALEAA